MISALEKFGKDRETVVGGLGFEPQRDSDGKFLIKDDTPEKESNQFYRQKGGSLYFDLASGGSLVEGLRSCLEAAKQEKCKVNYNTNSVGIVTVTPEMSPKEAVNLFLCSKYIKNENSLTDDAKKHTKIDTLKAQNNAPDGISLYIISEAENGAYSSMNTIINFCKANEIDIAALMMHYDMALGPHFDIKKVTKYHDEAVNIDKKITENYGISYHIKKDDVAKLKEDMVLSTNSPKALEVKAQIQQFSKGKDIQNG